MSKSFWNLEGKKYCKEYVLWKDIQEIIGECSEWPKKIRYLFWKRGVTHWDRLVLSAFVYVNALHPDIFFEWADHRRLFNNDSARQHMKSLFKRFHEGRHMKLYAWHVTLRRYEWTDGTPRFYQRK